LRVVVSCDFLLKYAALQVTGLARAGAEVTLLCRDHALEFGGDHAERAELLGRVQAAGVRVLELHGRLWDPRGAWDLVGLRRELRRRPQDVAHVHDLADPRGMLVLTPKLRALTIHDPRPHPGQDQLGRRLSRMALAYPYESWRRWAQLLVVHSEALAAELRPRLRQLVAVIPHGVEVREQPLPPPAVPAVGFFGRHEPYKGLEVLAAAMGLVWERRPEVRLRIAGSGSVPLPLSDPRVDRVADYLPEDQVEPFLASISLMALPYTQASQSMVGAVAIGAGVPVVASRLGALPELVLDDSYLVDPGDPAALADAFLRHLDDDLAARRRVLRDVAGPVGWEAVGRTALSEYERAIEATGSRRRSG
jgi:glycosyltransferase involved in cell wall biosynthesis